MFSHARTSLLILSLFHHNSPDCVAGASIYITDCVTMPITNWQFLNVATDDTVFIKIATSDLCITAGNGNRRVTVQTCDANNALQRWTLTGGTASWESRFELQPMNNLNQCVTQSHHPRQGETLYLSDCAVPRYDHTSLWNMV